MSSAFQLCRRLMVAWCSIRIFELLRSPGIDSKESIPTAYVSWQAGTITLSFPVPSPYRLFKKNSKVDNLSPAMGARNQVGIGLSYRPASLCSLATQFQTLFLESVPRPIAGLKFPTLRWGLVKAVSALCICAIMIKVPPALE
jgi:hypothetical protein